MPPKGTITIPDKVTPADDYCYRKVALHVRHPHQRPGRAHRSPETDRAPRVPNTRTGHDAPKTQLRERPHREARSMSPQPARHDRRQRHDRFQESLERNRRSAARHFVAWLRGETDEDHLAAATWNMITYDINKAAGDQ